MGAKGGHVNMCRLDLRLVIVTHSVSDVEIIV